MSQSNCSSVKSLLQAVARSRRGAAAVEFALMIPIISALMLGLVNYGLATFDKMELTSAARAGAQLALLDTTTSSSDIKQAVVDSTNLSLTTSDVTTSEACECADGSSVTCGATCGDGSTNRYYYTVSASYDHALLLLGTSITLNGSATVRTK
jgi:Flp pilus assembly protein TadG